MPEKARLVLSSSPVLAALVCLAAVAVSAGSIGHPFVFDDHMLMAGNAPVILGEAPLWSAFTYRYWGVADEASPNELYRPATILSFALNARILGPGPAGMHAGNVLLHAANAVLVFTLLLRLFGRPRLALLAALLFAVHPIVSEAVIPVAGRADLLATFLMVSSCLMLLASVRRRGAWILAGGLGTAFATFFACLAKETAFMTPLVSAVLIGVDTLRRGAARRAGEQDTSLEAGRRARRESMMTAVTLIGLQVFVLVMALLLRAEILGYIFVTDRPSAPSTSYLAFVNNPVQTAPPAARVLTALRVAVMAAGLMAWPVELSADYSFDEIPITADAWGFQEAGAILFAAIYLALIPWSARRFLVVLFALSWSALTYLLVSNLLFPIGTIFGERLLYLPCIGFCLLLAAGLDRLFASGTRGRSIAGALTVLLLALYAGRFMARGADWSSDDALFAATVQTSPGSAKAHSNRGFTLQHAGRFEEAAESFRRALSIAPGLTGSGVSLARCLMEMGRPAEAIDQYQRVMARDDGISVAWSGLGLAQIAAGRMEEAEGSFRRSLGLSMGGNREAVRGLGEVMARSGREQEGVALLERAVAAVPSAPDLRAALAQAHFMLGQRHLREGRREMFVHEMGRTVELAPEHGPARYNLAVEALQRGERAIARDHAREAIGSGYAFPPGFLQELGIETESETTGGTTR